MNFLVALLAIIIGVLNFLMPKDMIEFNHRFKFSTYGEPADWYVKLVKYGGLLLAISGIALIILSLSGY